MLHPRCAVEGAARGPPGCGGGTGLGERGRACGAAGRRACVDVGGGVEGEGYRGPGSSYRACGVGVSRVFLGEACSPLGRELPEVEAIVGHEAYGNDMKLLARLRGDGTNKDDAPVSIFEVEIQDWAPALLAQLPPYSPRDEAMSSPTQNLPKKHKALKSRSKEDKTATETAEEPQAGATAEAWSRVRREGPEARRIFAAAIDIGVKSVLSLGFVFILAKSLLSSSSLS
ncbi:hypothetical protein QBC39DRAFT_429856 [Podospora conica]|nr:hypothetical protein QBC39DRAFT_429856 [Schizothecium conicum]